jgi:hypothetical protein
MARQILPKKLREKILDMFREGYTELEVFDKVNYEAKDYVSSLYELTRCIASLEGKVTNEENG